MSTSSEVDTGEGAKLPSQKEPSTATATTTDVAINEKTSVIGENCIWNILAGQQNQEEMDATDWTFLRQIEHPRDTMVKRRNELGLGGETLTSSREGLKVLRRAFYLSKLDIQKHEPLNEAIRKRLERADEEGEARKLSAPVSTSNRELRRRAILVPEETLAMFAGTSETFFPAENLFHLRLFFGCRVRVTSAVESVGHYRKVILTGSPLAVKRVEQRFKRMQERQEQGDPLVQIQKPIFPVMPSEPLAQPGAFKPLFRGVWHNTSGSRRPVAPTKKNRRPPASVKDCLERVQELTESLPIRHDSGTTHQNLIATTLSDLFGNEDTQHVMSTTALNTAISYLLRHGMLSSAKEIISFVEHLATVDTYNILLKSAAARQNLVEFYRVLGAMSRSGVSPNAFTWMAYLDCLVSPAAKLDVIQLMGQKGFLQNSSVNRNLLRQMNIELFTTHLDKGGNLDEYVNAIASTPGLQTFPARINGQMIGVLAKRGDLRSVNRLLEFCVKHGLPLSSTAMNQVIRALRDDTSSAVRLIIFYLNSRTRKRCNNTDLDEGTYQLLFLSAFRNKHYNTCRVLWRYACMGKKVTWNMRKAVSFFLTQNIEREGLSQEENNWYTSAAKVMVGVDLHLPDYPLKAQLLQHIPPEFHENPIVSLMDHVPDGDKREKQRLIARTILKRDLDIGPWSQPKYPLARLLEAAQKLDSKWQDVTPSTIWRLQNAIHIPLKGEDPTLQKEKEEKPRLEDGLTG